MKWHWECLICSQGWTFKLEDCSAYSLRLAEVATNPQGPLVVSGFSGGDEILPSLCVDHLINHYIRIPILKKPSFIWKVRSFYFFRGSFYHYFKKNTLICRVKKPWKKVCKLLVPGIILKNVRESHPPFFGDHGTSRSFGRGTTRSVRDNK